jgi:tRNA threonylcarbamoyladenosine biosynthesis protein TsaB
MMALLTLIIEASTPQASVALVTDTAIVADRAVTSHDPITGTRLEGLMPAIAACFHDVQANPTHLSSIICSSGPGSFTSLRSAAAIAKGFCSVLHIPLYAVSSLELVTATAQLSPGQYMPALDAGRGEYYTQVMEVSDSGIVPITPITVLPRTALATHAQKHHSRLVGPNLEIDVSPRASAAFPLLARIIASDPVPLESWEPWYGRLAEAQVKWEAVHGRPLSV